ncbi:SHOCT domain-containing protein [Actinomadura roseirufa]|uniref:SHOCT domain-containing protein n=1 Tax=Actinomadura roseirufa TaxID=2094049 RepID=UPI0013F15016|nr:SHOCT domain-containing protein [Actinomadura roseirufa]
MDYPLLNAFLTMMWFFLWILWIMLLFRVIGDIFRDDGLGGWAKAGWAVFVLVLPFLGVFVYLIARGKAMGERETARERRREARLYGAARPADEAGKLAQLAELKNHGDLTQEEYERAKSRVLVG